MRQQRGYGRRRAGKVAAGLVFAASAAMAQGQSGKGSIPDAQVESNVLKALAAAPQLADQRISSNAVYGTVTLSGTVKDEPTRSLAETVVSRTAGVQKVIDELTLPGEAGAQQLQPADAGAGQQPQGTLMSDGTMAPSGQGADGGGNGVPQDQAQGGGLQQGAPQPGYGADQGSANGVPVQRQAQPSGDPNYPQGQQPQYNGQQQQQGYPAQQAPYGAQQQQQPNNGGQPYGGQQQAPYGQQQAPYGQQQAPYGQQQAPYGQQQPGYGQPRYGGQGGYPARPQYGAQIGGQPVTVPAGAMLRIRINQGLDSKHTQPGTTFSAVVLNDVVADGAVAIPRGADIGGVVTDSEKGSALRGRGELVLNLTQVVLGGRTFPLTTDTWSNVGGDKTGRTVSSAIGLGVLGAIVGGAAGGGGGAAVGAGLGAGAGVGTSAASGGGQAVVPPEAILTFHLTQPAGLQTVSQAEMDRLGYGVGPAGPIRRRPVPAGYGPGYGPGSYPSRY